MVAKLKIVAVVAGACVAGKYLDDFVKAKGYIKPDSSIAKFSGPALAGLAGLGAHMAGLL